MQPQQKFSGSGPGSAGQSGAISCAQCGSPMPPEMRFCRACGNRLGEGPAEYTETVRLPNAHTAPGVSATTPFYSAPMAARNTSAVYYPRKRRVRGMTWVWIAIAIFFASGGGLSMLVKNVRNIPRVSVGTASRSYVGVDGFQTTDGGVTFDVVEPPGSPADKAGLVGGDIVTSFDGHAISDDDQIMDLLRQTPIGKTVEVIYLRDGLMKKTQLTTISEGGFNQLRDAYSKRPEGKGYFGFESYRTTHISDPSTKTYGVRMDYVEANGPAELFGIQKGDIITDFDNVPIRTGDELLSRVRRAIPFTTVDVVVLRGDLPNRQTFTIPVKIGRAR